MKTLRGRLILSHILPILILIPIVGLTLILLLESQVLLTDLSDDLTERAYVIAEAVSGKPEILQDPDQLQDYLARIELNIEGEILFFGSQGLLLATNQLSYLDDVGHIPEIEGLDEAVQGIPQITVRYSWTNPSGIALVPVSDVNKELIGVVGVSESLDTAASQFGTLRRLIIAATAIALAVGIGIALLIANRMEQPLASVTGSIREIAEGRRIEPIPEEGPEEIQDLIRSVNKLADNLRTLETTRRRLLANIVHELGRPLGAIRAAIHTLRLGAAEDDVARDELMKGIEDEVIRMQPLLDDLAQLHGQVTGKITLNRREVELSSWLPPLVLPWRAAALEKGLSWDAQLPDDLPVITLDPDRISQVLGNLLSNAIKYTPKGGSVALSAVASDSELLITVRDSGPGIRMEEQTQVFEPFYRSTESKRFPQGLGLGLTIARDLVEAHGGSLTLSSQIGEGSSFEILLPRLPS